MTKNINAITVGASDLLNTFQCFQTSKFNFIVLGM